MSLFFKHYLLLDFLFITLTIMKLLNYDFDIIELGLLFKHENIPLEVPENSQKTLRWIVCKI